MIKLRVLRWEIILDYPGVLGERGRGFESVDMGC